MVKFEKPQWGEVWHGNLPEKNTKIGAESQLKIHCFEKKGMSLSYLNVFTTVEHILTYLNMCQQRALAAKKLMIYWAALGGVLPAGRGRSLLFTTDEATPGGLCPVLGSPV